MNTSEWKPRKSVWMEHSIVSAPIQFLTTIGPGKENMIIAFKGEPNKDISINIRLSGTPRYMISECFDEWVKYTLPPGNQHVWTFSSTRTSVNVLCNGVTVVDYKVDETSMLGCANNLEFLKLIVVKDADSATEAYRPDPKSKSMKHFVT